MILLIHADINVEVVRKGKLYRHIYRRKLADHLILFAADKQFLHLSKRANFQHNPLRQSIAGVYAY